MKNDVLQWAAGRAGARDNETWNIPAFAAEEQH